MDTYIEKACEQFRTLLLEQLARTEKMETSSVPKDFTSMEKITIGIVGGDGIGPIIMEQADRLLNKVLAEEIAEGRIVLKKIDGLTIENRMALGKAVPEDVLAEIKSCDVLLKGPTTTPKGGTLESANVTLRRELDLYANVRPVQVPDEGIDWIFYRENTEGEYVLGSRGVEVPGKLSMDFNEIRSVNSSKTLSNDSANPQIKWNQRSMLSGRTLPIVVSAYDDTLSRRLCSFREGFIAHTEAVLRQVRNVGAVRQNLCACRHDVVCGDVIANFKHQLCFQTVLLRFAAWKSLDVRSS